MELKQKTNLTRQDISELLISIGKPGKKRDEKIEAVKQLEKQNSQGIDVIHTLDSFEAF